MTWRHKRKASSEKGEVPHSSEPQRHFAQEPNEVWGWDVTYLPSQVRGMFFYLYAIIDLFSRKLVAWEVHALEGGEDAAAFVERAGVGDSDRISHWCCMQTMGAAPQKSAHAQIQTRGARGIPLSQCNLSVV